MAKLLSEPHCYTWCMQTWQRADERGHSRWVLTIFSFAAELRRDETQKSNSARGCAPVKQKSTPVSTTGVKCNFGYLWSASLHCWPLTSRLYSAKLWAGGFKMEKDTVVFLPWCTIHFNLTSFVIVLTVCKPKEQLLFTWHRSQILIHLLNKLCQLIVPLVTKLSSQAN